MNYDEQQYQVPKRLGELTALPARYQQPQPSANADQRAIIVGYFTEYLNDAQERDGRKPYSYAFINKKLTARYGTGISWLYQLKQDCEQAEKRGIPFGAAFWSRVNQKAS